MSIDKQELEKIAYLARLQLADDAIDDTTLQVNKILGFVELLEQADTEDVEPMFNPLAMSQPLREDISVAVDDKNLLSDIAPSMEQNLYLVPTVIE